MSAKKIKLKIHIPQILWDSANSSILDLVEIPLNTRLWELKLSLSEDIFPQVNPDDIIFEHKNGTLKNRYQTLSELGIVDGDELHMTIDWPDFVANDEEERDQESVKESDKELGTSSLKPSTKIDLRIHFPVAFLPEGKTPSGIDLTHIPPNATIWDIKLGLSSQDETSDLNPVDMIFKREGKTLDDNDMTVDELKLVDGDELYLQFEQLGLTPSEEGNRRSIEESHEKSEEKSNDKRDQQFGEESDKAVDQESNQKSLNKQSGQEFDQGSEEEESETKFREGSNKEFHVEAHDESEKGSSSRESSDSSSEKSSEESDKEPEQNPIAESEEESSEESSEESKSSSEELHGESEEESSEESSEESESSSEEYSEKFDD